MILKQTADNQNISIDSEGISEDKKFSIWKDAISRLLANKLAVISLVLILATVLISIIGPLLLPYDFLDQDLTSRNVPPSSAHWMGTDYLGRDVFSRIVYGARTALVTAFGVVSVSVLIGILLGSLSGFLGGWVDSLIMWFTDVVMAVPPMLLAMVASVALKPMVAAWMEKMYFSTGNTFYRQTFWADIFLLVTVLTLVLWPQYARLIRSQILTNKTQNYVMAARALGVTKSKILTRYIIPNSIGPVIVQLSAGLGSAMLWESAFSFLGIGVNPPIPSWGNMISVRHELLAHFSPFANRSRSRSGHYHYRF